MARAHSFRCGTTVLLVFMLWACACREGEPCPSGGFPASEFEAYLAYTVAELGGRVSAPEGRVGQELAIEFFGEDLPKEAVDRVFTNPAAVCVGVLLVQHGYVGDDGLERLATLPGASQLRHLRIQDGGITDSGLVALAGGDLQHLRSLSLPQNQIGAAGVAALASSRLAHRLETLDLTENPIGDQGASELASGGDFGSLQWLTLRSCAISGSGFRELLGSTTLRTVSILDLTGNRAGCDSLVELTTERSLASLRRLVLDVCTPEREIVDELRAVRPDLQVVWVH